MVSWRCFSRSLPVCTPKVPAAAKAKSHDYVSQLADKTSVLAAYQQISSDEAVINKSLSFSILFERYPTRREAAQ
jgi:hypothetical protein